MKKLAFAAAVALIASPAVADPVPVGSTGVSVDAFDGTTRGVELASLSTAATGTSFSAIFNTAVYLNTLGTLDFYYQVVRTGAGTGPPPFGDTGIQYLEGFPYDNLSVFAYVDEANWDGGGSFLAVNNPGGGVGTAFRSGDGNMVGIDLGGSPGLLTGTENSATYIFRTNATEYGAGTFRIFSRTALEIAGFAPVAVPEAGTWIMMLAGFGAIGFSLRRKKVKSLALT